MKSYRNSKLYEDCFNALKSENFSEFNKNLAKIAELVNSHDRNDHYEAYGYLIYLSKECKTYEYWEGIIEVIKPDISQDHFNEILYSISDKSDLRFIGKLNDFGLFNNENIRRLASLAINKDNMDLLKHLSESMGSVVNYLQLASLTFYQDNPNILAKIFFESDYDVKKYITISIFTVSPVRVEKGLLAILNESKNKEIDELIQKSFMDICNHITGSIFFMDGLIGRDIFGEFLAKCDKDYQKKALKNFYKSLFGANYASLINLKGGLVIDISEEMLVYANIPEFIECMDNMGFPPNIPTKLKSFFDRIKSDYLLNKIKENIEVIDSGVKKPRVI